ncbi:hypothetical protein EVAR_54460_1 [Eumeta japonica]|uniref:Uncharacterized protein n=1 Tax=Eumeta variegata TaxID=151549 RepID=A0A4C1XKI6_EUMVA|nr:hypothetical protein EVAR_54460_1 [Eumeta japonica]
MGYLIQVCSESGLMEEERSDRGGMSHRNSHTLDEIQQLKLLWSRHINRGIVENRLRAVSPQHANKTRTPLRANDHRESPGVRREAVRGELRRERKNHGLRKLHSQWDR